MSAPGRTDPAIVHNFYIIAHIDHGKSTLADRILQLAKVVDERATQAQYLDRMDIERERGTTIKLQVVRMPWSVDGVEHVLNIIDTPGHIDFAYEISRSLVVCEGAILLVGVAQGIEAQTLVNLYLALEAGLHIIPVLSRINLSSANPDRYAAELVGIIGCDGSKVFEVSTKVGAGVAELLDQIVAQIPVPVGNPEGPAWTLIFDFAYDTYRSVITYVRMVDEELSHRECVLMAPTGTEHDLLEVEVISLEPKKSSVFGVGEVGYLVINIKDVRQSRVGDTITGTACFATQDFSGYRHPNPMAYVDLYPIDGDDFNELREALEKFQLSGAALAFELETFEAFGPGFHVGFSGLLYIEIVRERLECEFNLDLIPITPNVIHRIVMEDGAKHTVTNPSEYPTGKTTEVREPVVRGIILTPPEYTSTILELHRTRRSVQQGLDYLSGDRVEICYTLSLAEIVFDPFGVLKSRTRGYASLDCESDGEQVADLVKADIFLHGDPVDASSTIAHKDEVYFYGLRMAGKLKELISRRQFEAPIQAAIGSRVIAWETIRVMRKNMLVKYYDGGISRKCKLLRKQRGSKKRMKMVSRVGMPQEAFMAALSTSEIIRK